jgi:hypothetical protein
MLALCPYCAQHRTDFCIPEFERRAYDMSWFENVGFQMSPSDIDLKPEILLENLKFKLPLHQAQIEHKVHRVAAPIHYLHFTFQIRQWLPHPGLDRASACGAARGSPSHDVMHTPARPPPPPPRSLPV